MTRLASRPCVDARFPSCRFGTNLGREFGRGGVGKWKKRRRRLSSYGLTLRKRSPLVATFAYALRIANRLHFFLLSFFFFPFPTAQYVARLHFFPFSFSLSLLLRPMQMERAGMERNWTNRDRCEKTLEYPRTLKKERERDRGK